jgi:hypothetical protein
MPQGLLLVRRLDADPAGTPEIAPILADDNYFFRSRLSFLPVSGHSPSVHRRGVCRQAEAPALTPCQPEATAWEARGAAIGEVRDLGVADLRQPAHATPAAAESRLACAARFSATSARTLGPANSSTTAWCTTRSMAAAVVIGSLKI